VHNLHFRKSEKGIYYDKVREAIHCRAPISFRHFTSRMGTMALVSIHSETVGEVSAELQSRNAKVRRHSLTRSSTSLRIFTGVMLNDQI